MTNIQFANSIRAIADFHETHPEMPQFCTSVFTHSIPELIDAIGTIRLGGATTTRDNSSSFVGVSRDFGGLDLEVLCHQSNIERIPRPALPLDMELMAVLNESVAVND